MHILFVVIFTLVGRFVPGSDLVICLYNRWLVVAGYYSTFINAYLYHYHQSWG